MTQDGLPIVRCETGVQKPLGLLFDPISDCGHSAVDGVMAGNTFMPIGSIPLGQHAATRTALLIQNQLRVTDAKFQQLPVDSWLKPFEIKG